MIGWPAGVEVRLPVIRGHHRRYVRDSGFSVFRRISLVFTSPVGLHVTVQDLRGTWTTSLTSTVGCKAPGESMCVLMRLMEATGMHQDRKLKP